ncbi:hypothetical protein HanXRQr2_Chr03g0136061 [Helianthus annuus]|uniref:Uncharacterized protein n=1 Tax=Helianthus annuus TaxID=4232 RepID=A0A9K3JKN6_HELAN|nr:hypothetical protein HanXRQr2_Chr03g0136061 [Helianthus annuus]
MSLQKFNVFISAEYTYTFCRSDQQRCLCDMRRSPVKGQGPPSQTTSSEGHRRSTFFKTHTKDHLLDYEGHRRSTFFKTHTKDHLLDYEGHNHLRLFHIKHKHYILAKSRQEDVLTWSTYIKTQITK